MNIENQYRVSQFRQSQFAGKMTQEDIDQEVRPTNSSMKTQFAIANTMIGSALVFFPLLFRNDGVITATLVSLFICALNCFTCVIQIPHFNRGELDLSQIINRILGKKWQNFFIFSSAMLLFLVSIIYYGLQANMIFFFLVQVGACDDDKKPKLGEFSYTYLAIILTIWNFVFFNLKELNVIIKLAQFGICVCLAYSLYIVVKGSIGIHWVIHTTDNIDLKIVTPRVSDVCGIFAVSFFVHNVVVSILAKNKNANRNIRDVIVGFGLCEIVYLIVGIFGAFALAKFGNDNSKQTVLEYFKKDVWLAIIELLLFFQLSTVLPIVFFCGRQQLFQLFYGLEDPPKFQFIIVTVVFLVIADLVVIFDVPLSMIMSFTGAGAGLILVYLIPVAINLKCLLRDNDQAETQPDEQGTQDALIEEKYNYKLCDSDHASIKKRFSPTQIKLIYGSAFALGAIICISTIIIKIGQFVLPDKFEF